MSEKSQGRSYLRIFGTDTFLTNHVQDLVSLDFFVVPTVTHKILFVLVILAHERRRIVVFT